MFMIEKYIDLLLYFYYFYILSRIEISLRIS